MGRQNATDAAVRHIERTTSRRFPVAPTALVAGPRIRLETGDLDQPYFGASIDKVLIATLIAQLGDEGVLTPETPIGELLPSNDIEHLPAAPHVDSARDITVDHLLSHTSGLPDVCDPPRGEQSECSLAMLEQHPERPWTSESMLQQARGMRPIAAPGARFHYSDTGYLLLTRIIEEAAGVAFAQRLRSHIVEPAGMQTAAEWVGASAERLAELAPALAPFWFTKPHQELSQAFASKLTWQSGLGGAASAHGLLAFQRALHAGDLCSREWVDHMSRPRNRKLGGLHYGAGMATLKFEGFMPLLHGLPRPVGGLGILATHMFYYPAHDTHVILNFHSFKRMNASFSTHIRLARLIKAHG